MAEHIDPTLPPDDAERAYREALLQDDAGREARRARLMAALPQPAADPVIVSPTSVALRSGGYRLLLMMVGFVLAALWVWLVSTRQGSVNPPLADPRVAEAPVQKPLVASAPVTVVAQAELPELRQSPAPAPKARLEVAAASAKAARSAANEQRIQVDRADAEQTRALAEAPMVVARLEPPAPVLMAPAAPPMPVAAPAPIAAPPPAAPARLGIAPMARMTVADAAPSASGRARAAASEVESAAASEAAVPVASAVRPASGVDLRFLMAVARGDSAGASAALNAGANVHALDGQGRTALMLAARLGSVSLIDLLLERGARKTDRDTDGWTAANHAQDQGHLNLADRLR